jgi:hypothetical protein
MMDYNAVVAHYNVTRALAKLPAEVPAANNELLLELDVPYLLSMGPSALPAIDRLQPQIENRANLGIWLPQYYSNRISREGIYVNINAAKVFKMHSEKLREKATTLQSDWRTWTLRFWNGMKSN